METERLLTIAELASALQVTRQTVYNLGDLPHVPVGNGTKRKQRRYRLSEVVDYLKNRGTENAKVS